MTDRSRLHKHISGDTYVLVILLSRKNHLPKDLAIIVMKYAAPINYQVFSTKKTVMEDIVGSRMSGPPNSFYFKAWPRGRYIRAIFCNHCGDYSSSDYWSNVSCLSTTAQNIVCHASVNPRHTCGKFVDVDTWESCEDTDSDKDRYGGREYGH
jgi:hypothetical protein